MSLVDFNLSLPNGSAGISAPNHWRAEWTNSPTLQEQFVSADSYAEHQAKLERERSAAQGNTPSPPAPMSEAQRIAAIDALALPGHEKLLAELKADSSVDVGQAAIRIATAAKARRAPAPAHATVLPFNRSTQSAAPVNLVAIRKQALADWEASVELQREFATAEAHANYEVAVAQGRVRIFRGPGNAA